MRGDHYDLFCLFELEVSQASDIQEEDITPLIYFKCCATTKIAINRQI